ncbi:MAG: hypothetical protein KJ044_00745, partial [Planctomycetes bacterium]|nr:hypothetical protein [Planctomycetota bacterium]
QLGLARVVDKRALELGLALLAAHPLDDKADRPAASLLPTTRGWNWCLSSGTATCAPATPNWPPAWTATLTAP